MCRASASTMTSMRCLIALRLTTCLSCCKRTREVVSSSPHATAPNGPGGERGSTSAPQRRFSCGLGRPRTIAQISTLGRVGPPLGTSSSTRSTRGTGRLLNATPPHTALHTHACPFASWQLRAMACRSTPSTSSGTQPLCPSAAPRALAATYRLCAARGPEGAARRPSPAAIWELGAGIRLLWVWSGARATCERVG